MNEILGPGLTSFQLSCLAAQAPVRVLDIGCGANLIYPLLGAAMHGWHFVGVDITDTAIEWAGKNAATNPHLAHLLEVRRVPLQGHEAGKASSSHLQHCNVYATASW